MISYTSYSNNTILLIDIANDAAFGVVVGRCNLNYKPKRRKSDS
jgi:hypothetical protein